MEPQIRPLFSPQYVTVMPNSTEKSFKSIIGCEIATEALLETIAGPLLCPYLLESRLNFNGVLMFGLVGIGKTSLARACVQEVSNRLNTNLNYIDVNIEEIESSYRSETEKNIAKLFDESKKRQPCVIVLDEIDSVMKERSKNEDESNRRSKSVLLKQFSDLAGYQVTVIGLTNRVCDLDAAFIRRFQRRIYVDLPTISEREQMLKMFLLKVRGLAWSQIDFEKAAQMCDGFSGAELEDVSRQAAHVYVRERLTGVKRTESANDLIHRVIKQINPANQEEDILSMERFVDQYATDNGNRIIKHKTWFEAYGPFAWPLHLIVQTIVGFFF